MKTIAVSLALALALAQSCVDAWTITETNATKPEEVLGKHLDFVKTWIVTGSAPLDAIKFAAAGPVFIDYDGSLNTAVAPATEAPASESPTAAPPTDEPTEPPVTETPIQAPVTDASGSGGGAISSDSVSLSARVEGEKEKVLAKIVFSGNCTKLLNTLQVTERNGELKVHFKNQDFQGFGYLLTQVIVGEEGALSKLSTSGSSSLYISEGVVASTANSTDLTISGAANLFVSAPMTVFTLQSLDIKVSGSGDVQFQAASLLVGDSLSTKISGDGTLAVVADTVEVNNTIDSKISGTGAVFIQAESVSTFSIETSISGEGDITISKNGSCVSQDISISGGGEVATGSIACVDTKIKMSGEGTVLVQTSNSLLVPHRINGLVQYVGDAPRQITDGRKPRQLKRPKHHGWFWWNDDDDDSSDDSDGLRYPLKKVTPAPANEYATYELQPVPPREPAFLVLTMRRNSWGNDPTENVVISIFGWDINIGDGSIVTSAQNLAVHVHEQHGVLGAVALGGVAVAAAVAVGVAIYQVAMQRRRRREYQPLLQVMTN